MIGKIVRPESLSTMFDSFLHGLETSEREVRRRIAQWMQRILYPILSFRTRVLARFRGLSEGSLSSSLSSLLDVSWISSTLMERARRILSLVVEMGKERFQRRMFSGAADFSSSSLDISSSQPFDYESAYSSATLQHLPPSEEVLVEPFCSFPCRGYQVPPDSPWLLFPIQDELPERYPLQACFGVDDEYLIDEFSSNQEWEPMFTADEVGVYAAAETYKQTVPRALSKLQEYRSQLQKSLFSRRYSSVALDRTKPSQPSSARHQEDILTKTMMSSFVQPQTAMQYREALTECRGTIDSDRIRSRKRSMKNLILSDGRVIKK